MSRPWASPIPSSSSQESPLPSPTSSTSLSTPPLLADEPSSDFEIVISHFNEDLSWLAEFSKHCIIYSKGEPLPASASSSFHQTFALPNIGRETHTYLTHIVNNYEHLPPLTLFLQGNIHEINDGTPAHTDMALSEIISRASTFSDGCTMPIGQIHSFSDWDGIQYLPGWLERRGQSLERTDFTPLQFWRIIFGSLPPESVSFVQGALFGVTRGAIRRRQKSFYKNVLRYFEELGEVNPEEGHYMERFWYAILSDEAIEKEAGSPLAWRSRRQMDNTATERSGSLSSVVAFENLDQRQCTTP